MKLRYFILLLAGVSTTSAADHWTTLDKPTVRNLSKVCFIDSLHGWVAGDSGLVLMTTNGGESWVSQETGISENIFDVFMVDRSFGWALAHKYPQDTVTYGTILLRTTNGGARWTGESSDTTRRLYAVSFIDANVGTAVAAEGTILHTTDGGALWTVQTSGTTAWLHGVSFTDASTGTVVGSGGTVLHTTNGGVVWTSQTSGTAADLFDVYFADADTGTTVGNGGTILRTTNGGANWTSQWSGTANSLHGAFFTDAETGTVVGQNGRILRTTNGGIYWTGQEYPVSFFFTVVFLDSVNGWLGGDSGKLKRSRDGGLTWSPATVDSSVLAFFPLLHFKFLSRSYGFALGGRMDMVGVVWKTTNGGDRWSTTGPSGEPIHGLHSIDSLNLLAVGGDYDVGSGMVRSQDGGRTWDYTYLGIWGEARALAFRTPNEGFAPLGFPGTYMVTTDTGRTWHDFYTPDSNAVFDVTFTDSMHGYMVGANGSILKYNPNLVSVRSPSRDLPVAPVLHQNYPNPFNPQTAISYQLSSFSYVVLRVYDGVGREVTTLFKGNQGAGGHVVEFSGEGLASGAYYYELTVGKPGNSSTQVRKMILLR